MTDLAQEFKALLPHGHIKPEKGPLYFLWVFDPHNDEVILEHNEDRHAADHIDHGHLAERVPHPERVHGFAYRIQGGWRITTADHRPVDDPHIKEHVRKALQKEKVQRKNGSREQYRTAF
jgi:hypothetical protein